MELILELTNRSGRTLERHRFRATERISIGRAYDNDLILSDETVDAHHAEIIEDQQGHLMLRDLNSINGIRTGRHRALEQTNLLTSGDEYIIGKTHLRIFRPDHPIAEAISLNRLDLAINYFGHSLLSLASALLLMLFTSLAVWNTVVAEYKWENFFNPLLGVLGLSLLVTLFWCLIGRIAKHEMRFKAQFTVITLFVIVCFGVDFIYEFILYNSMTYLWTSIIFILLGTALLASLFWLNLHIATTIDNAQRWKIATFLAIVIMTLSILSDVIEHTQFSPNPRYVAIIKAPLLRINPGDDLEGFLGKAESIFEHE